MIILDKMKNFIFNVETLGKKVNDARDRILFIFIKPYWPRTITPNHITYIRAYVGILLFILLFFFKIENNTLIVSLFFIGALTDLIDGSVARGTNRVTELGAMLDPVADKILIIPIAVYSLLALYPWLLLALITTEIINAIFLMYYKTRKTYLESNMFGKTKMFVLSVIFVVILFIFPQKPYLILTSILWLTIPISFLSIFAMVLELKK